MLKFPKEIKIKIVEEFTHDPINIKNIIISIHIFAMKKNDYYLGPFFSDDNGEIVIDKNMLTILAETELQTGIMDYKSVYEGLPLVEINILSDEEIVKLIKGRTLWGIIGREKELYNTKEELLNRIKNNNNNLVFPQSLQVSWSEDVPVKIFREIVTEKRKLVDNGYGSI